MTLETRNQTARAATVQLAQIVREYGPFPGAEKVNGVSFNGHHVWAATGARLIAFDPANGEPSQSIECACDAGTAFDGTHLYQIAEARIEKIDPATGEVVASIPAPGSGSDSGLIWAEGSLWVGQYRDRKIHQIDPATGAVKRSIELNGFVTGVTWVDGELWHGTWEDDESELRRIDPASGAVLARLTMPEGAASAGSNPTAASSSIAVAAQQERFAPSSARRARGPERRAHLCRTGSFQSGRMKWHV